MALRLGIVYWGRRGAGVRMTFTTCSLLKGAGIPFILSVSSGFEQLQHLQVLHPSAITIDVPKSRIRMLASPQLERRSAQATSDAFSHAGVDRAIILMPHPWDLSLFKHLQRLGIEVFQVTHDARPHPGELWPRQRDIDRRIQRADATIVLSESVAAIARRHARRLITAPYPELSLSGQRRMEGPRGRKTVLFVGRIRPYKGLDLLFNAWALVRTPEVQLVVAGEGTLPSCDRPPRTIIKNRWLSDPEIEELIGKSDVLVLPYTEASQSGLIGIARAIGTPVVTTPVGGLMEQYRQGIDGITARAVNPHALAVALDEALSRNWSPTPNTDDHAAYVQALLTP